MRSRRTRPRLHSQARCPQGTSAPDDTYKFPGSLKNVPPTSAALLASPVIAMLRHVPPLGVDSVANVAPLSDDTSTCACGPDSVAAMTGAPAAIVTRV